MTDRPLVVGIGGTMRPGSTSERVVRAVLAEVAAQGAETQMFGGAELAQLPHFVPDDPTRVAGQLALVEAVRRADGLVIGTPGYHGSMSGLVKNAIDLLDDLRGDKRCYLDGRGVGLVVTAAGWQACGMTLSALRSVVHAMRGWPTPIGVAVNISTGPLFDEDEQLVEPALAAAVKEMARQVLAPARGWPDAA